LRFQSGYTMKVKFQPRQLVHASEMLKALAHPVRLAIFEHLSEHGSCRVSQIQEVFKLEQAVVSQQLSILKSKDVLVCEREGKNSVYSLKYPCLSAILDCLNQCKGE
jgi:DNA-binding transcriptional ArsR family regulator